MKTYQPTLQPQPISSEVLAEKYCQPGETTQFDIFRRVSAAVASVEPTEELKMQMATAFYNNMCRGSIGAGRIMAAAGVDNKATYINCFVQPVGDAIVGYDENGYPGIYLALAQAGETLRRGGGVGYNFSEIRPKGAYVKGTSSEASGPCEFMDVFDKSCSTVMAAGARRGAQMGILNVTHPDIIEFIEAKRTKGRWNDFNVSVAVTDDFMSAVESDSDFQLMHAAKPAPRLLDKCALHESSGLWVYETIRARDLWDRIMKSAYEYAEPGVVFIDTMNRDNNLSYVEKITATNPCAEQPLPPYGCCDLGPLILPRFVTGAFTPEAAFDSYAFSEAVKLQVRFLDNVLDATNWPLPEQEKEAQSKRRIGVGYTGLGNALAMLNLHYDSDAGRETAAGISQIMRDSAYQASVELACDRGAFPLINADKYLEGTFASRLPDGIKDAIREFGIRNSHLLSIAPTGTVSLAFADNASNGIEPPFALAYNRKKRMADGSIQVYPVVDHALRVFISTLEKSYGEALLAAICNYQSTFEVAGHTRAVKDALPNSMVTALELSCDAHLAMLGAVQPFIDTSISKTVNVPAEYPYESFKELYSKAYRLGLKGVATYRPNDTLGAVLEVPVMAPKHEPSNDDLNPLNMVLQSRPDGELNAVSEKIVYHTAEGTKSLYLVVSFAIVEGIHNGKQVTIERPVEVFIPASQTEAQQWVSSVARLLSLSARTGVLPKALNDLRKVTWDKGPVRNGFFLKEDGTKVPRFHDSEIAAIAFSIQGILSRRGFLDSEGNTLPISEMHSSVGVTAQMNEKMISNSSPQAVAGKKCQHCGAHNVIKRDGCEFCTNCGTTGSCG